MMPIVRKFMKAIGISTQGMATVSVISLTATGKNSLG
jgi:hypothetical protein